MACCIVRCIACHGMSYCDCAVDAHEAVILLNQNPSLSKSGLFKGAVQTVCTPVSPYDVPIKDL